MKYIICILIAMFFLSACTKRLVPSRPVPSFSKEFSSAEYPPSEYMTAKGIGQSESEARRQAKAEMSNIFESKVFSSAFNKVKSVVNKSGSEEVSRDAEQMLRVVSSVEIKGLEIAKTWHDEKEGMYYALSVLDKEKARVQWQREVDAVDREIVAKLKSLDFLQSDFTKFQHLKKVRSLWLKREVFISRIQVLGFKVRDTMSYDPGTVFDKINQIKSGLAIFISLAEGTSRESVGVISDKLTADGYIIEKTPEAADIIVRLSIKTKPVDINNPKWKFARAIASVVIIDNKTDTVVGEFTENKRSSHLTFDEAKHRAIVKVVSLAAEKLAKYFADSE